MNRVLSLQSARRARSEGKAEADSLEVLRERLRLFREERDWDRFHSPRNLAVSMAIETGELLEHFQWIEQKHDEDYSSCHEEIAEELADVVIYAINLADVLDISLGEAVDAKIDRNAAKYPTTQRMSDAG